MQTVNIPSSMPAENLNVALLPLDIRFAQPKANIDMVCDCIRTLPKNIDLVVLPEMFNVGFGEYPDGVLHFAEPDDGPTVETMKNLSHELSIAICGGFIGKNGDYIYNRCFFVADGKTMGFYNKRHLFYGPESRLFTPGTTQPPVINYKSWRIRPFICFDLRFPVWTRTTGNDVDVMIFIANWPHARYYAWRHLSIARAIENQAIVLSCNREGEDFYGKYERGDSLIIDSYGNEIGTTTDDGTIMATLSFESFNTSRKKLQPWRVADCFELK